MKALENYLTQEQFVFRSKTIHSLKNQLKFRFNVLETLLKKVYRRPTWRRSNTWGTLAEMPKYIILEARWKHFSNMSLDVYVGQVSFYQIHEEKLPVHRKQENPLSLYPIFSPLLSGILTSFSILLYKLSPHFLPIVSSHYISLLYYRCPLYNHTVPTFSQTRTVATVPFIPKLRNELKIVTFCSIFQFTYFWMVKILVHHSSQISSQGRTHRWEFYIYNTACGHSVHV